MMQSDGALQKKPSSPWWNDGDALRTRLFDAISLLLPSGEQFVIDAVSNWVHEGCPGASPSSGLQQETQRFIQEEMAHQRAHRLYNDRLAADTPAKELERRIASTVSEMASLDLPTRLAFAAAFEHLTAMLSMEILRPRSVWLGDGAAPQIRLWQWHCQKEIDHRHVVANVSIAAGVGAGRRTLTLLAAALYLSMDVTVALAAMCRADLRARRVKPLHLLIRAARLALLASPGLIRMAGSSLAFMMDPLSCRQSNSH